MTRPILTRYKPGEQNIALAMKPSLAKRAGFLEYLAPPRRIFCIFPLLFIKRLRGNCISICPPRISWYEALVTLLPHPLLPRESH